MRVLKENNNKQQTLQHEHEKEAAEHEHTQEGECRCHEHKHSHDGECGCHEHEHSHEHGHSGKHHHTHDACGCHEHEHRHGGCACCDGGEIEEDKGEQKKDIIRIVLSIVLLIAAVITNKLLIKAEIIDEFSLWQLPMYLVPYFIAGYEVIAEAFEGIRHGEVFDENFLMVVATVGALCIGEYPEAVAVMIFFCIGELFEHIAVARSRKSIKSLAAIKPESAHLVTENGNKTVKPEQVHTGDTILVKVGEKIPLDGVIAEGVSSLDTAALTGESMPASVSVGDAVYSGSINLKSPLKIKVSSEFENSTVNKILEMVENSAEKKAHSEKFIRKFAKIYTPVVVIAALALAVIPPLIGIIFKTDAYMQNGALPLWFDWIHRALTFLVISCPCALVISVPLTFFAGVGAASKQGILVKGTNYLEALSNVKVVAIDKTGTLTKGNFSVSAVHSDVMDEKAMLEMAALAEYYSVHPISLALKTAFGGEIEEHRVKEYEEIAGMGISALVDGKRVQIGNAAYMQKLGVAYKDCHKKGTTVHMVADGAYMGHIVIADTLKGDAKQTISKLKSMAVKTVMLTGDKADVAANVAEKLGIEQYHAELLPQDKAKQVETLKQTLGEKDSLAFVGDGINDAPVLALADVGIAMGALGSDAAIESADVVLMDDKTDGVVKAVKISKRTKRIVKQNIIFSIAVKLIVLILGALGIASMWLAVFADVGVTVIAVANAMRAMKSKF